MEITAMILNSTGQPVVADIIGNDDDCLMVAETKAKKLALSGTVCCIRWHRDTDGQVAYWTPRGASLSPHWYGGNNRGGAGRGQGRKPADGKRGSRRNVVLDDASADTLRELGDGDLSLGIRMAAARLPRK